MLHIKFLGNRSADFRRKRFLKGFNIYGHGGHLGHVVPPNPWMHHIEFSFDWLRSFGEEDL